MKESKSVYIIFCLNAHLVLQVLYLYEIDLSKFRHRGKHNLAV